LLSLKALFSNNQQFFWQFFRLMLSQATAQFAQFALFAAFCVVIERKY
jgi:hypothetical protein